MASNLFFWVAHRVAVRFFLDPLLVVFALELFIFVRTVAAAFEFECLPEA
jgi:hypothetical protein